MLLGEEKLELELQENAPRKCLFHLRGHLLFGTNLKELKMKIVSWLVPLPN